MLSYFWNVKHFGKKKSHTHTQKINKHYTDFFTMLKDRFSKPLWTARSFQGTIHLHLSQIGIAITEAEEIWFAMMKIYPYEVHRFYFCLNNIWKKKNLYYFGHQMTSLSTLNGLCTFLFSCLTLPFSSTDRLPYNTPQENKEFEDWPLNA